MAYSENCGTTSRSNLEIIEVLKDGGSIGKIYTDADSDGYCGVWKTCIYGAGNPIIFDDEKEATSLMNQVVADWREKSRLLDEKKKDEEDRKKREAKPEGENGGT